MLTALESTAGTITVLALVSALSAAITAYVKDHRNRNLDRRESDRAKAITKLDARIAALVDFNHRFVDIRHLVEDCEEAKASYVKAKSKLAEGRAPGEQEIWQASKYEALRDQLAEKLRLLPGKAEDLGRDRRLNRYLTAYVGVFTDGAKIAIGIRERSYLARTDWLDTHKAILAILRFELDNTLAQREAMTKRKRVVFKPCNAEHTHGFLSRLEASRELERYQGLAERNRLPSSDSRSLTRR